MDIKTIFGQERMPINNSLSESQKTSADREPQQGGSYFSLQKNKSDEYMDKDDAENEEKGETKYNSNGDKKLNDEEPLELLKKIEKQRKFNKKIK